MTSYWIDRVKVGDEAGYAKYREGSAALACSGMTGVQPHPLSVDGRREVLEGSDDFDKLVIWSESSFEKMVAVHASPEYQAAARFRQESGSVNEVVVAEGVEGAPHDQAFGAYWVAFVTMHNPEQYQKYIDAAAALLPHTPAKVLVGGGRYEALESPSGANRFILVGWSTFDEAVAQFHSEGYRAAAALRRDGGGEAWIAVVEAARAMPWDQGA